MTRATVVGAGLAGLSAAVALREAGVPVTIVEAAAQAGGRCRSYHDPQIGRVIDNGNHLVLSGNAAVHRFRDRIGAKTPLAGPPDASFAFADLATGKSWTVRINHGRFPRWIFSRRDRVPGSGVVDYLPILRLLSTREARVDERFTTIGPVWEKLLEPVLLAALNTPPGEGSARLTANVLRETIAKGGAAMRPQVAEPTLAAAFIDPATAWLAAHDAPVALGRRLRAIRFDGEVVTGLDWSDGPQPIAPDEPVILAVPPWVTSALVPDLVVPDSFHAIVNAHFDVVPPSGTPPMLGLLGGTAEWLFAFDDRLSITVSAADRLVERDREDLARTFWADICAALGMAAPLPRWQVVKEKRATFAATPDQNAKRPPAATRWRNLFLAGDWTDTGLPATIEGALRSGETAAGLARAGQSA
ncbi:hydroxysqualene dehydroxylase HpnE [Hephaestia mangrovi]|uniref:hydroxysqualene dehydroxylase HpnE n=1 Tax=Hephaestia mangrovi TaxID=2873268 RepID=UPI001CA6F0E0|nr:hydroxysqualene dehydroxylase HpnE [Hephaestia mangrovi]MBY8828964.1 hydroxysqualene dehydroxylase HpnE [Hephaestia mangrovi]